MKVIEEEVRMDIPFSLFERIWESMTEYEWLNARAVWVKYKNCSNKVCLCVCESPCECEENKGEE